MEARNRFIAPERMGAWIIVSLGTALAAFVISIWGVLESRATGAVLQVELIKYNERIQALEKPKAAAAMPAPAMAPAIAPAMPAEEMKK